MPYSKSEIEAEELKVKRLQASLDKAVSEKQMLETYDHPRDLRKLRVDLANAQIDLKRANHEAERNTRRARVREQSERTEFEMHTEKLAELKEEESKLIVKAETEGLVVYDDGRRHWQEPLNIAVAEEIGPRQQLMIIPDMTTLGVTTKVYESRYSEVQPGLPAFIRLDAKPDVVYPGKVEKVAVLPDDQNWWTPGVKVFDVEVVFDGSVPADVKPGMTSQVELQLGVLSDVLQAPVAAIFTQQEKTYCWVIGPDGPQRRQVKIGRMNDTHVEIRSGLEEGETVLLAQPESAQGEESESGEQPGPARPTAAPAPEAAS